jgi:hypothetical protein
VVRSTSQRGASSARNLRLPARTAQAEGGVEMTILVIVAALVAAAAGWAVMAPRSPDDLTTEEMIDLVVLGFVP